MTSGTSGHHTPDARYPERRRAEPRPGQATTAGVLLIVFGALGILITVGTLAVVNDAADHGESVPSWLYPLEYLQVGISGLQILSGCFVLVGRAWAPVLATVIAGLNVVGAIVNLANGAGVAAFVGIILNMMLIGLVNREDVRVWCG